MTDRRRVRCADCSLDLAADEGMLIRAAFSCPLFGKVRSGVERECVSFVPRVAAKRNRAPPGAQFEPGA